MNITEVYPTGRCYLKVFFNAVEAWCGDRDLDGWRLTDSMFEVGALKAGDTPAGEWRTGYPLNTRITYKLIAHANALLALLISETPLMAPLRPTDTHELCYCIGDASAEGFAIVTQHQDLFTGMRDGLWDELFAEGGFNL